MNPYQKVCVVWIIVFSFLLGANVWAVVWGTAPFAALLAAALCVWRLHYNYKELVR